MLAYLLRYPIQNHTLPVDMHQCCLAITATNTQRLQNLNHQEPVITTPQPCCQLAQVLLLLLPQLQPLLLHQADSQPDCRNFTSR